MSRNGRTESEVRIETESVTLEGTLTLPERTSGLVIFAHGSGSSRRSERNRFVAAHLNERNFGTLLFDLLTAEEEAIDARTRKLRFDIGLLAQRLTDVVEWVSRRPRFAGVRLGLFGASTGAAAALITAAQQPAVHAVVSRGGRPDLAGSALSRVSAPTLLIVGGDDEPVLRMNQNAATRLKGPYALRIIPRATHLFEEPGALERVAELAATWFTIYLGPTRASHAPRAELR
jgi:dienelactone hydrolase